MNNRVKDDIVDAVKKALSDWLKDQDLNLSNKVEPFLELPKQKAHGDLSTNVAFQLAPVLGKKPFEIANGIKQHINISKKICEKIETAGAGFINFYLNITSIYDLLRDVLINRNNYGKNNSGDGENVLLEFVSANPTGPLTIAHARQAAVGDVLANILTTDGFNVKKEYYLNDRGRQMNILGLSVMARYKDILGENAEFPSDGYKGEYIRDIAQDLAAEDGKKYQNVPEKESLPFFTEYAKKHILKMIINDLEIFGVHFDNWISEKELIEKHDVERLLQKLERKGYVYHHEGATWFKSTDFGDDKDRVLIKNNKEMTYLTPDIVYHNYKYERKFTKLINIWGPDHHGYISRLKAAIQALDHSGDSLNVLIVQLTTLYRDGQPVSMSTRAGEFVSLKELVDEVGKDAARYYLVMRRPESHLDFDLEIAKKETPDNPVYYIQYAHARIFSIFGKYKETTGSGVENIDGKKIDLTQLKEQEEMEIIKYLSQYPIMLRDCSRILSPHLVTDYLEGLVSRFHNYYEKHRIISSEKELTTARIALVLGIKIVLRNGLDLLGVSVPEKM